jgi:hypothetical protein
MAVLDFDALARDGLTVIYTETAESESSPGADWECWGQRVTPDESVTVWRKIVTLAEADTWREKFS